MNVTITKVSQDVNLANGDTENFVLFELPNGSIVRAKVNEAAAQAVMGCFINGEGAKQQVNQEDDAVFVSPSAPPQGFREVTTPDGTSALEYGGGPAPVPRARARHVAADASGNPIVNQYVPDMGEISSSGEGADEDGVGQV